MSLTQWNIGLSDTQPERIMPSMDSIYDEARVPAYTLPDPLFLNAGSAVTDARVWNEQRRPELLDLFARSCVRPNTN